MIPMPTSRVFRSRSGALWWSLWVIVGAVLFVGFGSTPQEQPANAAELQAVAAILNTI